MRKIRAAIKLLYYGTSATLSRYKHLHAIRTGHLEFTTVVTSRDRLLQTDRLLAHSSKGSRSLHGIFVLLSAITAPHKTIR